MDFLYSYPIKNSYVFYLPQTPIFDEYRLGDYRLKDINIYTEPSMHDWPSDDYRFNTFHCNTINDPSTAWAIGLELITLLRSLVTIYYGEEYQRQIRIEKMIDEKNMSIKYPKDNFGHNINIANDLHRQLGLNIIKNLSSIELIEYRKNATSNLFNSIIYQTIYSKHIGLYPLLKYFSEPLTWSSLYKIMETLETIQKLYDSSWSLTYSRGEKKKFTNSANNYSIIGIDSRHGLKNTERSDMNTSKMSLTQAKEIFMGCVKSYLEFKHMELKDTISLLPLV